MRYEEEAYLLYLALPTRLPYALRSPIRTTRQMSYLNRQTFEIWLGLPDTSSLPTCSASKKCLIRYFVLTKSFKPLNLRDIDFMQDQNDLCIGNLQVLR